MTARIVGAGSGLSASLLRQLTAAGQECHIVSRGGARSADVVAETGATQHLIDATDTPAIQALIEGLPGRLDIAIYNPSARVRGPLIDLNPDDVRHAIEVTAHGAFVMGQAAAKRMLAQEGAVKGTILFTGASAGVKGFPKSAPFAMGKFAQRGLAESMARELHPQGIHVAWINIDGAIAQDGRSPSVPDGHLDPEAIATAYLGLWRQDRSAWSHELSLRPWVETF